LTLNSPPIRGNSPTATLMNDGKVLLVGGFDYSAVHGMAPQAWKYDPVTNAWSPDANLLFSRSGHRANLLPDGGLLVTGGSRNGPVSNQALDFSELYRGGHFGDGGPLQEARMGHTATSLSNGDVLVVGGSSFSGGYFHPATTTEVRAPGGWSSTLPPNLTHAGGHTANRLWNGWVAVIGGNHDGTTASTYIELYDPLHRTWMPTASLVYPRQGHTATTLLDGRILIDGGSFWTTIPSELFSYP
jgi:Galactose oxidase, central domain